MPSGLRAAASEEKRNGGRGVEIRDVPPYSYSSMGSISVTSAQFQLAHCGQCQFICNSRGQVARLKFAFHSILFRQRFWPGLAWPGCKCAHYAPRCCACLTMTLQTLQLILNPNSSLKPNWTVPGRNCDLKRRPCIINWASYLHLVSHTHAHTFACIHITLHTHR